MVQHGLRFSKYISVIKYMINTGPITVLNEINNETIVNNVHREMYIDRVEVEVIAYSFYLSFSSVYVLS